MVIRVDKFVRTVPTSDDWCPNFTNSTVEVNLNIATPDMLKACNGYPPAFVSVWGADDFGMIREFHGDPLECVRAALDVYHILTYKQKDLTIKKCQELSLVPA